jgi:biotin carboxyl carrier protein
MPAAGDSPESERQSTRDLAELVRSVAMVMNQADVSELDLDVGSLKLRLRRLPRALNGVGEALAGFETSPLVPLHDEHFITAPMIGTFYSSPSPGTESLVAIGDEVQVGQPVGIIEAMKIMNEISADRSGIVEAVLVENGQAVEYGTPLFRLAVGMVTGA